MIDIKKLVIVILVCCFYLASGQGQSTITSSGSSASGSWGSVSYTIGQTVYNTYSGTSGSIIQGVQQPYEISVVTAIENTEGISLECSVYPNPTSGVVKLIIKSFDIKNLRYRLFDLNGVLLQDKNIDNEVTEIFLENQPSTMYILKIVNNNQEIKVFKIIKN